MSALECPVCLEAYDGAQHEPKILPCSGAHELCDACLRLLRAQASGNFRCPECREKIETAARINTNRGLLAALQSGPTTAASAATKAPIDPKASGDLLTAPNDLTSEHRDVVKSTYGHRWLAVLRLQEEAAERCILARAACKECQIASLQRVHLCHRNLGVGGSCATAMFVRN